MGLRNHPPCPPSQGGKRSAPLATACAIKKAGTQHYRRHGFSSEQGEAPSEPDFAVARREARVPGSCKGICAPTIRDV